MSMRSEHTPVLIRPSNAWTKADSKALLGFAAMLSGWLMILVILVTR